MYAVDGECLKTQGRGEQCEMDFSWRSSCRKERKSDFKRI